MGSRCRLAVRGRARARSFPRRRRPATAAAQVARGPQAPPRLAPAHTLPLDLALALAQYPPPPPRVGRCRRALAWSPGEHDLVVVPLAELVDVVALGSPPHPSGVPQRVALLALVVARTIDRVLVVRLVAGFRPRAQHPHALVTVYARGPAHARVGGQDGLALAQCAHRCRCRGPARCLRSDAARQGDRRPSCHRGRARPPNLLSSTRPILLPLRTLASHLATHSQFRYPLSARVVRPALPSSFPVASSSSQLLRRSAFPRLYASQLSSAPSFFPRPTPPVVLPPSFCRPFALCVFPSRHRTHSQHPPIDNSKSLLYPWPSLTCHVRQSR